jgi:hypothetical protein
VAGYNPVYSQGFIYYGAPGDAATFEVPEGFTAILREASIYTLAGGTLFNVYLVGGALSDVVTVASLNILGIAQYGQWQGRVVVPEGTIIGSFIADLGSNPQVYLGGYLLRNVAT